MIEIKITPEIMQGLLETKFSNFDGCDLFSDIYFDGTISQWTTLKPNWENCTEKKLRYAAIHLSDGTVEQELQHEGSFRYIKQGGFGTQKMESYVYNCDLSGFFGNAYNYNHNLAQMSIRVSMAAMSDDTYVNSSNIEALMDDLNITKRKVPYPYPEYDNIGYAMGTRRIYHNNQKKTLIMIAIRGGGYGLEWGGNANVGAGEEHEGFDDASSKVYVALSNYIDELKDCGFVENDDKDIVVWISGYSRGAATANLLAAKLDDNYQLNEVKTENCIENVQAKNVFAYCFECPRNTTNASHDHARYNNIYNIINPKDFVTYVAMNNGIDWRFNRYGKDLVLPDEANTKGSDYVTYYMNMKSVYQAGNLPEFGVGHSEKIRNVAKKLGFVIPKMYYPVAYQAMVQDLIVNLMVYEIGMGEAICRIITVLALTSTDNLLFSPTLLTTLGTELVLVKDEISVAHYPELCMAWMDSVSEEILTRKKSFWNIFVNCPVDIYVYEEEKLLGCIKNDVPQHIENGIITMLDSNGQKQMVLPSECEYKIVYKATGDGTMTISTSKYMQTEVIPELVTGYYELPLKMGKTYEALVADSNFVLYDSEKNVVKPSVVQTGAEVKMYKIDINVEGNGEVSGVNAYSIGEFAKVSAHPAESEKFLGWYENGKLISKDAEYRFCVKTDVKIIAKFTDSRVYIGKCYKINKHTYKVTSIDKRTVSFVKTIS